MQRISKACRYLRGEAIKTGLEQASLPTVPAVPPFPWLAHGCVNMPLARLEYPKTWCVQMLGAWSMLSSAHFPPWTDWGPYWWDKAAGLDMTPIPAHHQGFSHHRKFSYLYNLGSSFQQRSWVPTIILSCDSLKTQQPGSPGALQDTS